MEVLLIQKWVSTWLCVFCMFSNGFFFFGSNYMAFMIKKKSIEKMAFSKRRNNKEVDQVTTCQLKGSCKKGEKRYFLSID